ncbi:MAG: magnesium transporter [Candidatus Hydromicrobium sp.]|nr:magnesium transporter [Candidatus Hydromicrobium sp.]
MISYELHTLIDNIEELIKKKDWEEIKNKLLDIPASDIAYLMEHFNEETELLIFRLLPKIKSAKVFAEFETDKQESILKNISNKKIKQIILDLHPDDRTEIFGDLPGKVTQTLLNILPINERKEALSLLSYSEDSVGRLMTPDYIAVKPSWTIRKALEHIKEFGKDAETINIIYVVDDKWHLIDSMPIRKFILSNSEALVKSLMDRKFVSIYVNEDQEKAAKKMKKYDMVSLPVIDPEGILIGIVTIDDILDVLEEETTEDFQKGAAVAPFGINYTTVSPWMLYVKRVGWLSILLVAGFISSKIIANFETTLESVIALAFFIPILIDTGGNTSTQSATLIIRALATGDLTLQKWFSVVKKELLTGFLLGISMGCVFFLRSLIFKDGIPLALTLSFSIICVMILANFIGAILPMILTKIKLDPALISSPLLTTIIDALGLLIYFYIARFIFSL